MTPKEAEDLVWQVGLAITWIFGTFGNIMTLLVLRTMPPGSAGFSTSLFIGALAVSDLVMVNVIALPHWLEHLFGVIFKELHAATCQGTLYLVITSGMTSAWFLVSLTLQRVVCVMWPHLVASLITKRRAKIAVVCIILFFMALNTHLFPGYTVKKTYDYYAPANITSSKFWNCTSSLQLIDVNLVDQDTNLTGSSDDFYDTAAGAAHHSRNAISSGNYSNTYTATTSWHHRAMPANWSDFFYYDDPDERDNGSLTWNLTWLNETACVPLNRSSGVMCGWKANRNGAVIYDDLYFPYIDMTLSAALPAILIIVSNAILGYGLFQNAKRTRALMMSGSTPAAAAAAAAAPRCNAVSSPQLQDDEAASTKTAPAEKMDVNAWAEKKDTSAAAAAPAAVTPVPPVVRAREKAATSVTFMVMGASLTFLVLTLPVHCFISLVRVFSTDPDKRAYEKFAFAIVNVLWASNGAINFYIYTLTGTRFREQCKKLLRVDRLRCCRQ